MKVYVGIDWAKDAHAICVLDGSGKIIAEFEIRHLRRDFLRLTKRLGQIAAGRKIKIAIESRDNVLTSFLVDASFEVSVIHPNKVKSARRIYSSTGGNCDRMDAFVIAKILFNDEEQLRTVLPDSEQTASVRALESNRQTLCEARHRLVCQLGAHLKQHFPGAAELFSALDRPISLAFLTKYPTYESTLRLGVKRMARFLTINRYSGNRSPNDLVEHLRSAPAGATGLVTKALRTIVLGFVRQIECLNQSILEVVEQLSDLVAQHEVANLFEKLPCTGVVMKSMLICIFGDRRERFDSAESLAALAGVAPVTYASGQRRGVTIRRACRKDYRHALHLLVNLVKRKCPWTRALYDDLRARGKRHCHASRIIARAWLRILFACWKKREPFDPAKMAARLDKRRAA